MLVCEVLQIATDDEQMQDALVHRFETTNARAGMRVANPETELCFLPRTKQPWSRVEVDNVRLVIAWSCRHERHPASWTLVTRSAADVPVHRTPVRVRRGGCVG